MGRKLARLAKQRSRPHGPFYRYSVSCVVPWLSVPTATPVYVNPSTPPCVVTENVAKAPHPHCVNQRKKSPHHRRSWPCFRIRAGIQIELHSKLLEGSLLFEPQLVYGCAFLNTTVSFYTLSFFHLLLRLRVSTQMKLHSK
jgi:hypothetical protein